MTAVREFDRPAHPHRPTISIDSNGQVHLVWNQWCQDKWRIVHARLEPEDEKNDFLDIIRDGESIRHLEEPAQDFNIRFDDDATGPGQHFYFARVKVVGDPSFNASHRGPDFDRPFATDGP
ncbi:MAG: hypothetical protein ACLFWL_17760 [Candidatus Brocadiia bacterium]